MTDLQRTGRLSPRAAVGLTDADRELLLRLLALRTTGPLETGGGEPVELWEAQHAYAEAAGGSVSASCTTPPPGPTR